MHGVQAVSPPLLLHRFAQLRLIGELLGRLDDLLLQRESALQVSQKGILFGPGREQPSLELRVAITQSRPVKIVT